MSPTMDGPSGSAVMNPAAAIATMLENAIEELFTPYTEGLMYIEKDCETTSKLYVAYLEKFTKFHVRLFFTHSVPAS